MTLILTVNGHETIWMLADRRLSRKGRPSKDDARKMMFLVTDDGEAILGYAGLSATARGTEPADWMSAVLRGRRLPLEQSLGILANALKAQFPRHMGTSSPLTRSSFLHSLTITMKRDFIRSNLSTLVSATLSAARVRWGRIQAGHRDLD
jgi:hypothetical protein